MNSKSFRLTRVISCAVLIALVLAIPFDALASNPFSQGQCTWWAFQRLTQLYGHEPPVISGNAGGWYDNCTAAGLSRGSQPQVGAIACWNNGLGNDTGHVAIVEAVYSDHIHISEYNWDVALGYSEADVYFSNINRSSSSKPKRYLKGYIYVGDPPSINNRPFHVLDTAQGGAGTIYVSGWAFDPDEPGKQLDMHIYINGNFVGALQANQSRPDVDEVYHTGAYHGYEGTIPLAGLNGTYSIDVAALDTQGGDPEWESSDPVSISLDTVKPTISGVNIDSVTKTSFRAIITATDNVIVESVKVPVWRKSVGGNGATWFNAQQSNATTWICNVSRGTEEQIYYGHVYAYDLQGNESSVGTIQHSNLIVSFNANGGTCNTSSKEVAAAWFNDTAFQTYGTLPTPSRTGCTFDGWFTSASGGSRVTSGTKVTNKNNHTLYAHWKDTEAPVITDGSMTNVTKTSANFAVTATDNVGVDHVDIIVWHGDYTADQGNAVIYPAVKKNNSWAAQVQLDSTQDDTWYIRGCVYDAAGNVTNSILGGIRYITLTFNANGGTSAEQERPLIYLSFTLNHGERQYIATYGSLPIATKEGYAFDGWFTEITGGTKITADSKVTNRDSHTLYAHWTPNQYTISYNANAGGDTVTGMPAKQIKIHNINLTLASEVPVRDGYTFMGWAESPNATEKQYDPQGIFTANRDVTLYAVWQIKKPSITTQPSDITVNEGSKASFRVVASRATAYQWYYQKPSDSTWYAVSSGGASATYTLTTAARHNGYKYKVKVSNTAGYVYSNIVTLTVNLKPVITTQPTDQTVNEGAKATFKMVATGADAYQWYYQKPNDSTWNAVSNNGTSATYSLTTAARHNGYKYRVKVSNSAGAVWSNAATLTVNLKPVITTQPSSQKVNEGAKAMFKVVATGATGYQWYYQKSNDSTWYAVSNNGTSATYTLTTAARHNGYKYKVKVSNSAGYIWSNTVTLTVTTADEPTITTQPTNQTVNEGANVTFKVVASNAESYQWHYQKPNDSTWYAVSNNGTSATYSLTTAARHNGYKYRVKVSNSAGYVWSNTVTLTVNLKPVITGQPSNVSTVVGKTVTFKVTATGATSYQWYYQKPGETTWIAVTNNGTSATYTLTVATRHNGYKYKCEVINAAGSVYSNIVTLTVK